jgi:predicted transcriptional regulator
VGEVVEIRGKTEQRVAAVVQTLQAAKEPLTYEELQEATGSSYDACLYILAALHEVGLVERENRPDGPGRPRVLFRWVHGRRSARAMGARSA